MTCERPSKGLTQFVWLARHDAFTDYLEYSAGLDLAKQLEVTFYRWMEPYIPIHMGHLFS